MIRAVAEFPPGDQSLDGFLDVGPIRFRHVQLLGNHPRLDRPIIRAADQFDNGAFEFKLVHGNLAF
jgi:hypothetical protein